MFFQEKRVGNLWGRRKGEWCRKQRCRGGLLVRAPCSPPRLMGSVLMGPALC